MRLLRNTSPNGLISEAWTVILKWACFWLELMGDVEIKGVGNCPQWNIRKQRDCCKQKLDPQHLSCFGNPAGKKWPNKKQIPFWLKAVEHKPVTNYGVSQPLTSISASSYPHPPQKKLPWQWEIIIFPIRQTTHLRSNLVGIFPGWWLNHNPSEKICASQNLESSSPIFGP